MIISSYVRSTDIAIASYRKPCGKSVFGCVDVPVNVSSKAAWTTPATNIQREFVNYKSALKTPFRTRKESVYFDQPSPVPLALVLKLTKQFPPRGITNTTSKLAVLDHVSNREVFDSYQAILLYQTGSQLVQKISTSIFNFGVYPSYFKTRFMPVVRAFGFPIQFLLRRLKLLAVQPIEILRVGYLLTIAGTKKVADSGIYTDILVSWWEYFYSIVIDQQRNEPSTGRFEFNGNGRRFASLWKTLRPYYIQRFLAFSQPQFTVFVFKSRLGKLSRTSVAFFLKPRVFGSFCPEVSKCFLQVSQTLLQRYAANLVQKVQFLGLFPTGKKTRGLFVINPFLSFVPGLGSNSQSFIVDQAHTPNCSSQEVFLRLRWVKAVLVGTFSHALHFTVPVAWGTPGYRNGTSMNSVNNLLGGLGFPLAANTRLAGVSSRED
jgi:hypothetical protein